MNHVDLAIRLSLTMGVAAAMGGLLCVSGTGKAVGALRPGETRTEASERLQGAAPSGAQPNSPPGDTGAASPARRVATRPFAVVELFTSEGCSSCPPADELLSELARKHANDPAGDVLLLAYHVDYWDRLGWKDPFSQPDFTARQQAYSRAAQTPSVYTPQMIVNGDAVGFVGSDRAAAQTAISGALAAAPKVEITAKATLARHGKSVTVSWKPSPALPSAENSGGKAASPDMTVDVLLVQPAATTEVRRGENAGKTLSHHNVVRALRSAAWDATRGGFIEVAPPADLKATDLFAVALVRNSAGVILCARQLTLERPGATTRFAGESENGEDKDALR